jgi:hypothetical protein
MAKRDPASQWESWVREALRGRHLHQPPASALRSALVLGSQLKPRPTTTDWLVTLLFDSASQPLPAAVRGVSSGQRRLLYQGRTTHGDEIQVDLCLRRGPDGMLELTGQLLPPWARAHAVVTTGRVRRKQPLGDAGDFVLRRLPARSATIRLDIRADDGDEVALPEVPVPVPGVEPS